MATPSTRSPAPSFHEHLHRAETTPGPSDRAFGFTVGPILMALALRPLLTHRAPDWRPAAVGAALVVTALLAPKALHPFNLAWKRLGDLLGRVMGPVMLGILFYLMVTPLGWLMRVRGADPMRRRIEPTQDSYWLPRQPPGPVPETMINQF